MLISVHDSVPCANLLGHDIWFRNEQTHMALAIFGNKRNKATGFTMENYPDENQVQLVLGAQGVSRSCYLLILATPTRHSKGAALCRYTGVARKVPFKLRPKDRKKVSVGY